MSMFKKLFGNLERKEFHKELAGSVQFQDDLMMMDIAKVLHQMPEGSSVFALRKYRETVLGGVVVLNGDITLLTDMFGKGLLNPEGSPGAWRLIPEIKLNLLAEFENPPEAALAFLALSPSGDYALALSHIVRSDGEVQWVTDAEYICSVASVLAEVGLLAGGSTYPST